MISFSYGPFAFYNLYLENKADSADFFHLLLLLLFISIQVPEKLAQLFLLFVCPVTKLYFNHVLIHLAKIKPRKALPRCQNGRLVWRKSLSRCTQSDTIPYCFYYCCCRCGVCLFYLLFHVHTVYEDKAIAIDPKKKIKLPELDFLVPIYILGWLKKEFFYRSRFNKSSSSWVRKTATTCAFQSLLHSSHSLLWNVDISHYFH